MEATSEVTLDIILQMTINENELLTQITSKHNVKVDS